MKAKIIGGMIAAATLFGLAGVAQAADITGAGSSFAFPVYAKWADAYKTSSGIGLNYQSIGSGAGIKQILAKTVTFAGTDAPMTGDELKKAGLVQWPTAMGGIVPVVNIDGVAANGLVLDGTTLAGIYLGTITKCNDAAIAKLNPGAKLPDAAITVVRRSDGSGTTFNFTDYLSKVSADWKTKVGSGTAVEWPVGVGAKGNDGVAGNVAQTKNSIGYVETAYAKQNKMTTTDMVNLAGKRVSATVAAVQAAASNADWAHAPGYYQILTNEPGDASWPITAATFALMYAEPADKAASVEAVKFFDWAFANGDKLADSLDYIAMPDAVKTLIRATWASDIKNK